MRLEIQLTADDKASQVFEKAFSKSEKSVKKFESKTIKAFANIQTNISGLVKKIAGIAAAFASIKVSFDFTKSIVRTADTFEKLKLSLATVEGSMKKANESFKFIQEFTAKTPYNLEEVTSAFVKLRTYGIDPLSDNALRVVGDVASAFEGMGKTIDDVVEALADAQMGEFERLKEFGIKASKEGEQVILRYADAHGQMVEKVIDNNEQVIRSTLLAIWNEKYGGQMSKLSNTWTGMMSNLEDNWTRFKQMIAESGFMDYMKSNLKSILDWTNKMFDSGKAQKWASVIGKSLVFIGDMFYSLFDISKTIVVGIFNSFIGAFKGIYNFGKRIFTEEGFFESMIDAFIVSVKTLPKVFVKGLGVIAMQVVKWASELFRPIIVAVEWAADNIVRAFKRAINDIKKAFVNLRNWIAEKLSFEKEIFGKKISFKLFDKVDYKPIFEEAETQYISFAETAKRVNKEQKELIKSLSKLQADFGKQIKQDWKEALKRIRESGKAGEMIANGLESYVNGLNTTISLVSKKVEELKAKGVKGVEEIQAIIDKVPERTKKALNGISNQTKKTTEKMKSFWKDFFESISRNPFWKKLIEISNAAWKGIKNFFSSGAKEGETGLTARIKNSFSSVIQGASVGGIVGAGAAFLTDQLLQNEKIRNALSKIFDVLQRILEPIADVIAPVIESIAPIIESFRPIFQLIADLLRPVASILKEISAGVAKAISFITSTVKPIWEGIKSVADAILDVVKAVKNSFKSVGDIGGGVLDFADDLWDATFGGLFHNGGLVKPVVAHNGMYIGKLKSDEVPAVLQTGEYVINRRATQRYRPILEAINSGKDIPAGDTNITVNIYAQSVDRRFVEDELLPLLEEYYRRGKLKWE